MFTLGMPTHYTPPRARGPRLLMQSTPAHLKLAAWWMSATPQQQGEVLDLAYTLVGDDAFPRAMDAYVRADCNAKHAAARLSPSPPPVMPPHLPPVPKVTTVPLPPPQHTMADPDDLHDVEDDDDDDDDLYGRLGYELDEDEFADGDEDWP